MLNYINKVIELFNNDSFIKDQVQSSGSITDFIDSSQIAKTVVDTFNPFDDIHDIINALETYKLSLDHILSTIEGSKTKSKKMSNSIDNLLSKYTGKKNEVEVEETSNTNDISLKDFL
jgi:hypothetical protein